MSNPATRAARALLAALVHAGVRDIVLCPGSRSAPLAFAALDLERADLVRVHVRHDERVGAFTALGAAKIAAVQGTPRPAVVITTSGTATANLHPAVMEAAHSHLPLIALTADRPHELRGVGANQTTDQTGLYGLAVRWSVDIPARDQIVDDAAHDAYFTNLAARATAAALGASGEPGPVHLNLALREPLTPEVIDDADGGTDWVGGRGENELAGFSQYSKGSAGAEFAVAADSKTVVLAGDGAGPAARELAETAGWPLFAEPSSGARCGANAIGPYRLLLDTEPGSRIERVIVYGHATLSRPVQQLLARPEVEVIVVHRGAHWPDPPRRARAVVGAVTVTGQTDGAWLQTWQEAGVAARGALTRELGNDLNGPNIAQAVVAATGARHVLWFGSSNPVRDADLARPSSVDRHPLTAAHRGLAGIDGTVSAATGAALASGLPTRVLLGDLTFIHDLGALILGPLEAKPQLQIVVLDDNGGGIFETLEQGGPEYRGDFERIFGTPHGQNLAALAQGMGLSVQHISDMEQLRDHLARPIGSGIEVLIIAGERADRRGLAQRLAAAVRAVVSK